MKKNITIILALVLALSLAACTNGKDSGDASENAPASGSGETANPGSAQGGTGGSGSIGEAGGNGNVFVYDDKEEIITFQFEDDEHRQAVEEWLKTVLFAEDYFAFIYGDDYDAPYDFDDETPIWLDERSDREED